MSYKTILTYLDDSEHCMRRRECAIELAKRFDAHLVGLAAVPLLMVPGAVHAEVVVQMLTEQWEREQERAKDVLAAFVEGAQLAGVGAEPRFVLGEPERVLCLHARYADLVIISQPRPDETSGLGARMAETVLLDSGRPVLILPLSYDASTLGTTVLVAWNASREATRALTDAIPMLQSAKRVDVVTVNAKPSPEGHGELPGADIARYLARHGIQVDVHPTYAGDADVGPWLLSRALDLGSDLIVMGGYGHSRLRQLVLGGATRTLLDSMTVPVLMSH